MPDTLSDDITTDFVNELKDYIPLMRDRVDRINGLNPEASKTHLIELHRLVHAIRGASALLKLNNLSKVASEFETIVEEIINDRLIFDTAIFYAAGNTIEYFDAYTQEVPCNDAFDEALRADVLASLHDIRQRASSNDKQGFLSRRLDVDIRKEPDFILPLQDELLEGFYQEAEDHFQDLNRQVDHIYFEIIVHLHYDKVCN